MVGTSCLSGGELLVADGKRYGKVWKLYENPYERQRQIETVDPSERAQIVEDVTTT